MLCYVKIIIGCIFKIDKKIAKSKMAPISGDLSIPYSQPNSLSLGQFLSTTKCISILFLEYNNIANTGIKQQGWQHS